MTEISEFIGKVKEYIDLRHKKAELSAQEAAIQEQLKALEANILQGMEQSEQDKISVEGLGTIYRIDRFTVQTPKSRYDKKALFSFLEERGIFNEMVSVNSQTLNAFYKEENAAALKRGDVDFKLPGVGEPKLSQSLGFRKA